jgi:formylglycine-generating enzyme required for sulfatase activity
MTIGNRHLSSDQGGSWTLPTYILAACFLLALSSCNLIVDFTLPVEDGGIDRFDDYTVGDGAETSVYCHSGSDPCPAGTNYVPCGTVIIGSDSLEGDPDEEPEHVVSVSAYCIDTTEVSNRDYADCVADGVCTAPYYPGSRTRPSYYTAYAGYPVLSVDWNQADACCRWMGKRLPTEAEWEKAARGGCEVAAPPGCGPEDERVYPWGDWEPTCALANLVGCVGDTDRVGAHPTGASPYGVLDLSDNVHEWVGDWYAGTSYDACRTGGCIDPSGPATGSERVFRGGSWESVAAYVRNANRFRQVPGFSSDNLGFRCAGPIR